MMFWFTKVNTTNVMLYKSSRNGDLVDQESLDFEQELLQVLHVSIVFILTNTHKVQYKIHSIVNFAGDSPQASLNWKVDLIPAFKNVKMSSTSSSSGQFKIIKIGERN